jgi:hypothetical protein
MHRPELGSRQIDTLPVLTEITQVIGFDEVAGGSPLRCQGKKPPFMRKLDKAESTA